MLIFYTRKNPVEIIPRNVIYWGVAVSAHVNVTGMKHPSKMKLHFIYDDNLIPSTPYWISNKMI